LTASAAEVLDGFRASAYSFQQLATALAPLLKRAPGGGAVVGLTVDSSRVIPGYGWMGVYKAALEAIAKYLATHLGPSGIRVNLVAAGPIETVSALGVPTFPALAAHYEKWAPLGWDRRDPTRVTGALLFLLSDLSRCTTGQVVYADGGMHALLGGVDATAAASWEGRGRPASRQRQQRAAGRGDRRPGVEVPCAPRSHARLAGRRDQPDPRRLRRRTRAPDHQGAA